MTDVYQRIYRVIARIPRGRVATYGQIAAMAGIAGKPRQVGYALRIMPEGDSVPWHRVVNAQGQVSLRSPAGMVDLQRQLLEREGIRFDDRGRLPLTQYRWAPSRARQHGV
jgi:methylated-DNA-protein-cysteine methyltransferase-like protein